MKSKFITHIILDGPDGVGKSSLSAVLWPMFNFEQRVYVRGELSDYVYAKKFGRPFVSTQTNLPFLHVLLYKSREEIKQQIIKRDGPNASDLSTLGDMSAFIYAAQKLDKDYHIICVDISGLDLMTAAEKVYAECMCYINNLPDDPEINSYNDMYAKGASKLGKKWTVKGNQTFLDGTMIKADAQLHNGRFETIEDKSFAHNLIFSLAYKNTKACSFEEFNARQIDFCYPIASKLKVRKELYEYFEYINRANKSCLIRDDELMPNMRNGVILPKCFGDDFIKQLSRAKATVYTNRDLAYLEMITVRPYESTLANNIMFVDIYTDPCSKLLQQIYDKDNELISALTVTPANFVEKYEKIVHDKQLVEFILKKQHEWYDDLVRKEMAKCK